MGEYAAAAAWPRPPSLTIWSPPPSAPASGKHVIMGAWVKTEWEQGKGSFAFLELKKGGAVFVRGAGAAEAKKDGAAGGSTAATTAMACKPAVCSASALAPLRHRYPLSVRLAGIPAVATTSPCSSR
uniref:Uncharacterized protein n=1 Tax=Oryza glaberrima TaxID=4538 RepID=I1PFF1_ORYGL